MCRMLLLTALVLSPIFALSQTPEEAMIEKFFSEFREDKGKALDNFYATNPWMSGREETVLRLKHKLLDVSDLMGDFLEEELLAKSYVGKDFVVFVYFAKYERQPLRFTFQLYRVKDQWMLFHFQFDDLFAQEAEEMLKYEYLQKGY